MGPAMEPTVAPAGVGGRPRIGIVGLCKDGGIGCCGWSPGWNPPITGRRVRIGSGRMRILMRWSRRSLQLRSILENPGIFLILSIVTVFFYFVGYFLPIHKTNLYNPR